MGWHVWLRPLEIPKNKVGLQLAWKHQSKEVPHHHVTRQELLALQHDPKNKILPLSANSNAVYGTPRT